MKTLNDIKQDMSELYDSLKAGETDIKMASELANVAGKFLKAEAISLAQDIFLSSGSISAMNKLEDKRRAA